MSSQYDFGNVETFRAAATVPAGEGLDGPTEIARTKAYELAQEWGSKAPHRMGLFRIHESWDLEEKGGTWLLTFAVRVRVVTIEESVTMPGRWSYDPSEGFIDG